MCRDITSTLHKTMARSFLNEFASRLNININPGDGDTQQRDASIRGTGGPATNIPESLSAMQLEKSLKTTVVNDPEGTPSIPP